MSDNTKEQLKELVAKNRLPHGVLLSSQSADELLAFARDLAQDILGAENLESQADFIYVESHKVEDIKKFLNILSLKSFGKRVVILDKTEQLTHQAVNHMLKKLEEPSLHDYFLVLTTHAEKLLPTLRSRLMFFSLSAPANKANQAAQDFLRSQNLAERLAVVGRLDPHEDDLTGFFKAIYYAEVENFSRQSVRRLPVLLRTFELMSANVQASRALSNLALNW